MRASVLTFCDALQDERAETAEAMDRLLTELRGSVSVCMYCCT